MPNIKPKIALVSHRGDAAQPNRVQQDEMGTTYTTAIVRAGGLPFVIPLDYPLDALEEIRENFDGLLLIGGGDVETARYGGIEDPTVSGVWQIRDELEIRLAQMAYAAGWPVFGICRGCQVMNVAAEGQLYSDIPSQVPGIRYNHQQPSGSPRDGIVHPVLIQPGTLLRQIIGKDTLPVNSFHHQAVSVPGKGMIISAGSDDGIPEAIEIPGHPFALGVQWHPECMQQYPDHMALFRAFVNACRK